MTRSWFGLAVVFSAACANAHERPAQRWALPEGAYTHGTPDDIHTAAGEFDGYRVRRLDEGLRVAVTGTGSQRISIDTQAQREHLRHEVLAIAACDKLSGSGFRGTNLQIMTYDYRAVDGMVERIGNWLKANDLVGTIDIVVSGVAVSL